MQTDGGDPIRDTAWYRNHVAADNDHRQRTPTMFKRIGDHVSAWPKDLSHRPLCGTYLGTRKSGRVTLISLPSGSVKGIITAMYDLNVVPSR